MFSLKKGTPRKPISLKMKSFVAVVPSIVCVGRLRRETHSSHGSPHRCTSPLCAVSQLQDVRAAQLFLTRKQISLDPKTDSTQCDTPIEAAKPFVAKENT